MERLGSVNLQKQPESSSSFVRAIVLEIIDSIEVLYATHSHVHLPPVEKEALSFRSFMQKNNIEPLWISSKGNFYQSLVHQQHTGGLCGYHALFNLVQSGKLLKSQNFQKEYLLLNPAAFWRFHVETTKFLVNLNRQFAMRWNEKSILKNELERSYMRALKKHHPHLHELFDSNDSANYSKLLILEFQFAHFVASEKKMVKVQEEINTFIQAKPKGSQHHSLFFMLGVTNHWISFLAHKTEKGQEFVYFDSRNTACLDWNETQIESYLKMREKERQARGEKAFTPFELMVRNQSIKDIQEVLHLLFNCFEAQQNLVDFKVDSLLTLMRDLDGPLSKLKGSSFSGINMMSDPPMPSSSRSTTVQFLKAVGDLAHSFHYLAEPKQREIIEFLKRNYEGIENFTNNSQNRWAYKIGKAWKPVKANFKEIEPPKENSKGSSSFLGFLVRKT